MNARRGAKRRHSIVSKHAIDAELLAHVNSVFTLCLRPQKQALLNQSIDWFLLAAALLTALGEYHGTETFTMMVYQERVEYTIFVVEHTVISEV